MEKVHFEVSPEQAEKMRSEEAQEVRLCVKVKDGKLAVRTGVRAGVRDFRPVNAPFLTARQA